MKILIIDDEWAARKDLRRVVRNVVADVHIKMASNAGAALRLGRSEAYDVIFLDIQIPDMDGLTIAREILEVHPQTNIVVTTANPQYALEAVQLYVCDFIVKPIQEKDIRNAFEHLRWPVDAELKRLRIQCFGLFEVYWNGKPLTFSRSKTKELLAYVIDHNGASCTADEIAVALWDNITDMAVTKAYIRGLIRDLRHTLDAIGMGGLIIRQSSEIAIRKDMLECDYFKFLEGDKEARKSYRGEYMSQYPWAEYSQGDLLLSDI